VDGRKKGGEKVARETFGGVRVIICTVKKMCGGGSILNKEDKSCRVGKVAMLGEQRGEKKLTEESPPKKSGAEGNGVGPGFGLKGGIVKDGGKWADPQSSQKGEARYSRWEDKRERGNLCGRINGQGQGLRKNRLLMREDEQNTRRDERKIKKK